METVPAEMLERIFRLLPHKDLKTVVLVCRRWRQVGEAPRLWAWVVLTVTRENISYMPGLLEARRLQAVKELVLTHIGEDGKLLKAVVKHQGLKKLEFVCENLGDLEQPEQLWPIVQPSVRLLGQAMSRMEVVTVMEPSVLTSWQEQEIFKAIALGESKLTKLHMDFEENPMSSVEPGMLARALGKIREVRLPYALLGKVQIEKILDSIIEGCKIKILDVEGNILTDLDPQILAEAVCKLDAANLNDTDLTTPQIKTIFTAISSDENILLKDLNIGENEVQVKPELLAAAVTKLERLNLNSSGLSSNQTGAIFSAIQAPGSRLSTLELQHNDLSSVEPGLLARAVTRLEEVNFQNAKMTPGQASAILTALCGGHCLKRLRLVGSCLLDEHLKELVASTIQKLKGVDHDLANILNSSGSEDEGGESSEEESDDGDSNEGESGEEEENIIIFYPFPEA